VSRHGIIRHVARGLPPLSLAASRAFAQKKGRKNMTDAAKSEKTGKYPMRDVLLEKSGIRVCVPDDWDMADTTAAQRAARKQSEKFPLYLAQRVCLFDGVRQNLDWIENHIHGKDGLRLVGELLGGADDEDDEGNA